MPLMLPTPTELAAMSWHKREKAIQRARRLLRDYGDVFADDMTEDLMLPSAEARRRADVAWGEQVRAEARRLAGECA